MLLTGARLRQHTADAVRLARSLIPRLEEARKEAEAANQAKTEFLARVTHELRTPLNGIIVSAHLMQGTDLTPEQRRHVATMDAAAAALMGTINKVLDLSKIEAGKLVLERTAFGLRDVLARAVAALASEAQRKGLALTSAARKTSLIASPVTRPASGRSWSISSATPSSSPSMAASTWVSPLARWQTIVSRSSSRSPIRASASRPTNRA
jgi:signal transduction histidine kinase